MKTGIYRVRKSFWGRCILQELTDCPLIIGSSVDASIRVKTWEDVKWNQAPGLIREDFSGYDKLYSNASGNIVYEPANQETDIDFMERMRGF